MKLKRILTGVLSAAVAFSSMVMPAFASETTETYNVSTSADLKDAMTKFTTSGKTTAVININNNITMSDDDVFTVDWSAMSTTTKNLTFNGNEKTISGLKNPLIKSVDHANKITFNDVTLSNADFEETANDKAIGLSAFVGYSGEENIITFNNCKVTSSTIKLHITDNEDVWLGAFVGIAASGGNATSVITLNNCETSNNNLECDGSVGAVVGHATGSKDTKFVVNNVTVSNNNVTCTESNKKNKAGAVCGTIGLGDVTVVDTKVSGNTVKSDGTEINDTIYGRIGSPTNPGTLSLGGNNTLNGSEYVDDAAFVNKLAAKVGNDYYTTLEEAYEKANAKDTITLLRDVKVDPTIKFDKEITIDLNNHTFKVNSATNWCMYVSENVTFKNGTVDISGEAVTHAVWAVYKDQTNKVTMTFDKVTLQRDSITSVGAGVFLGQNGYPAEIVFNDSVINLTATELSQYTGKFVNCVDVTFNNTKANLCKFDGAFATSKVVINGTSNINVTNCSYAVNNSTLAMNNTSKLSATGCTEPAIKLGKNSSIKLNDTSSISIKDSKDGDIKYRTDIEDADKTTVKVEVATTATLDADVSAITTGGATVEVTYVAKIGDDKYTTLSRAMDSLKNRTGDVTITLLSVAEYSFGARTDLAYDGNITIDGGNYTLNLKGTDTDWSSLGNTKGKLIFKNATIDYNVAGGNGAWNNRSLNFIPSVEMEDVTVNRTVTVAAGSSFKNVKFNENGNYCLWIKAGTDEEIIVDSCTFTTTNDGRGIKIADQYEKNLKTVNLTLTNSTFETQSKAAVLVSSTTGANIAANGNTITGTVDSSHIAWVDDDYADSEENIVVRDTNGKIISDALSKENKTTITKTAVAQIGSVEYTSLAKAIEAAKDGDTVTLLADSTNQGIVIAPNTFAEQGITVDFGGHTYTVGNPTVGSAGTETNGFQLNVGNKITFKNGKITSSTAIHLIQNYADLKLENMTLDGSKLVYDGSQKTYTLSHNSGNLVVDKTTTIIGEEHGYAFDVSEWGSYSGAKATVENGAKILGDVQVKNYKSSENTISLVAGGNTYTANGDYVQYNNEFVKKSEEAPAEGLFAQILLITNMEIQNVQSGENSGSYYPLAVYTAIDSLNYKEVGFKVRAVTSKGSVYAQKATTVVYNKMIVTKTDNTTAEYTPSQFGFESGYLFGQDVLFPTGDTFTNADTDFYVTPYAIKTDGTIITGTEAVAGKSTDTTLFRETQNN